jgi:hypothetical protein
MVNNSTNINKNHLSLQLIEWWSTIPNCWPSLNELRWEVVLADIGGIVDHHSMSWGERWFLLILVELLTITQWVEVRGDFCQYQQKSPLTSTHWMMVNNSTNINKNHLSPKLIDWWSTIPSISTKITSHLNSRGFLLILVELLTITQWVKVRGDFFYIGGIVDHHSMS